MNRLRLLLRVGLVGCGGVVLMWGAGSCLPYNFYAGLLGDSITAFLTTITSVVAGNLAIGT